jgi:hypothetical protein
LPLVLGLAEPLLGDPALLDLLDPRLEPDLVPEVPLEAPLMDFILAAAILLGLADLGFLADAILGDFEDPELFLPDPDLGFLAEREADFLAEPALNTFTDSYVFLTAPLADPFRSAELSEDPDLFRIVPNRDLETILAILEPKVFFVFLEANGFLFFFPLPEVDRTLF